MKELDVSFKSNQDGLLIFARQWVSAESNGMRGVKAVIQMAHGMAEHSGRYEEFAQRLIAAGYVVFAHDHRGHGKSAVPQKLKGKLADRDGWKYAVEDVVQLSRMIKQQFPDHPLILFGHSMGSFLARRCLQLYGDEYDGVILSGTGGDPGRMGQIGLLLANLEKRLWGKEKEVRWINRVLFGGYNRPFRSEGTPFQWLTRDREEVSKYMLDPDCGQIYKTTFYYDLIDGVSELHRKLEEDKLRSLRKDFPILLFSGTKDPVGGFSKGVRQVYDAYKRNGFTDVTCKLYEDGRHEMLHEINREDVFADVIRWLDDRLEGVEKPHEG